MTAPIPAIYYVIFATLFGLGILFYLFFIKKESLNVIVGRYSAMVWITSILLEIFLKYFIRFYFSSWYASNWKKYQIFSYFEWTWETLMDYAFSMVLYLPLFMFFSLALFHLTKTTKEFKSLLSFFVILYGIELVLLMEGSFFEHWSVTAMFCLALSSCLLFPIWIFRLNIKTPPISPVQKQD